MHRQTVGSIGKVANAARVKRTTQLEQSANQEVFSTASTVTTCRPLLHKQVKQRSEDKALTTRLAQGAVVCAERYSVRDAICFFCDNLLMIQAATGYETPFTLGQSSHQCRRFCS